MKLVALPLIARGFSVLPTASKPFMDGNGAFTPKFPSLYNFGFDAAASEEEVLDIWNGTNESGANTLITEGKRKGQRKWKGLDAAGKLWFDRDGKPVSPLRGVYGVGICCKQSRIIVIDIDVPGHSTDPDAPDGWKEWQAICSFLGIPPDIETFTVRTGSGGLHIYFRQPEGVCIYCSASLLAPGIDIKSGMNKDGRATGQGGQVVAPGNVFEAPDGTIRKYEIVKDVPIADMPPKLIAYILDKQSKDGQQRAQQVASSAGQIAATDLESDLDTNFEPALAKGKTVAERTTSYIEGTLSKVCSEIRSTKQNNRNITLDGCALRIMRLWEYGTKNNGVTMDKDKLIDALQAAGEASGLPAIEVTNTINSAIDGVAKYGEPDKIREIREEALTPAPATGAPAQPEEWPAIVEYGTTGDKLRIAPIMEHMPEVIRDFCEGLAESAQVPQELCFAMLLPAISTCVQSKFRVHVYGGFYEPVNVYTLCPLPPANRKSAVVRECTKPLRDWEKMKREELQPKITKAKNDIEAANRRLLELSNKLCKISTTDPGKAKEREKIQEEMDIIRQNKPEVPTVPRLLVDDITPEKMASVMAEQHGKIGMITAEGGIFDILAGMYSSSGAANIQIVLKGWTGTEEYTVDRIGRDSVILSNPLISIGIAPQPGIMQKRQAAERFRMSGLDGRFLYFMPDSLLGSRKTFPPELPKAAQKAYHTLIRHLLNVPYSEDGEPHVLELSTEARKAWGEWDREKEDMLKPGGDMAEMSDWGGKIAGEAARLAGLLHLAETQGDLTQSEISVQTMNTAVLLARFLCQQAIIAYELLGGDEKSLDAQKILEWIRTNKLETFTASECQQKFKDTSGLKDKKIRETALQDLIDRYYIREVSQQPTGKTGRKPGIKYQVNPAFFAGKTEGK